MTMKEQQLKAAYRYRMFLTTALLTMMSVVLGGCNLLSGPSAIVESQEGSTSTASSLTEKAKYHISWTMHQNLPVPQDAEMLKQVEEQFGVKLDIWNMENNKYESLLDMKLAQGSIPDLFRIRQPQDLLKYQQQGVLAEIPVETLNEYAPNLMRIIHEQAPAYEKAGVIEGKYYGIPVINPTNIYRTPVVYRQDWLDKLGLPVPQTLAEFEKVIYAFTFNDPDGNGIQDTYGLSSEGMNVLFGAFGQIVFADQLYFGTKDGKKMIGALDPEMKEALAYLRKWYKDGVIDPEFVTGENKGGYKHLSHAFINGKIGMTSMGNYYHWIQDGDYEDWRVDRAGRVVKSPAQAAFNVKELTAKFSGARVVLGRPFAGPHGQRGSKGNDMLMSFTAIGADADKEPGKLEMILRILDEVSANPDPDKAASMSYGMQNKHWVWTPTEPRNIVIMPPYDTMFGYQNTIGANIGMTVPLKETGEREQWAATLHLDQDGIYNALEVATPALAKYGDALIRLKNKAYVAFITGERPLSEFDEFVQEFMSAGGAEVVKEANALKQ
ncbi:putative aldouronate transport system substrate-binding protein [Paenibacillus sp. JGP012]|uniref:extracellular solute-binding protein n=1 Tax=Paenibacillus sp. JGP012 TaxID=2735914 RepID=UPI0017AFE043|nr:extracellular solute-binding protein [Paenibacillus sp. JGP012]MBB6019544.1 putative aldouronate transport system substrate-binding protein [Paenibacillus sp. JGP012]